MVQYFSIVYRCVYLAAKDCKLCILNHNVSQCDFLEGLISYEREKYFLSLCKNFINKNELMTEREIISEANHNSWKIECWIGPV